MLRAKDVMSTNVISVKEDDPIFDAVKLLEQEEADSKTVGDYMTNPAVSFEDNNALLNVCNFLLKNIFRRVPVTSGGRLIGIISVQDVLKTVLQSRQEKAVAAG